MSAIRPFRPAAIALAALALAAAPRAMHAQDVEACYASKSGSMYRVNAAGAPAGCSNGGTKMTWPSKLPSGTVYGMQLVSENMTVAANTENFGSVACPAGSVVMSGGYGMNFGSGGALSTAWDKVTVRRSDPTPAFSGLPTTYGVSVANNSPHPVVVSMRVICAKVAP